MATWARLRLARLLVLACAGLAACDGANDGANDGGGNSGGAGTTGSAGTMGGAGTTGSAGNAGNAGGGQGGSGATGNAGSSGNAGTTGNGGNAGNTGSSGNAGSSGTGGGAAGAGGASGGSGGRGGGAAGSGGAGRGGSGGTAGSTAGAGGRGGSVGSGGATGAAGAAGSAGGGAGGSGGTAACLMGHITYTLQRAANPTADQTAAYARITAAMDTALMHYNCYTNITKALSVTYVPSVATADGNPNGSIRFGSTASMQFVTAMHETGHTLGVGAPEFDAMISNGIFTGPIATAQLREITGNPQEQVHGDNQHFWPYGLNYESEYKSMADLVNHCKMVVAIRKDIGYQ